MIDKVKHMDLKRIWDDPLDECMNAKQKLRSENKKLQLDLNKCLQTKDESAELITKKHEQQTLKLQKDLEIVSNDKQCLIDKNKLLKQLLEELKEKNLRSLKDKEKIQTAIDQHIREIDYHIQKKSELNAKLKNLGENSGAERDQLLREIKEHEKKITGLEEEKESLVGDISVYNKAFDQIINEKQQLQEDLNVSRKEYNLLEQRINNSARLLEEANEKVHINQREVKRLAKTLELTNDDLVNAEQDKEELNINLRETIVELTSKHSRLEKRFNTLKGKTDKLRDMTNTLIDEISTEEKNKPAVSDLIGEIQGLMD